MRMRWIVATVCGLGLLTALLATAPAAMTTATSAAGVPHIPLSESVSSPLLADCSSVTTNGRGYARLHGIALCGADTIPPDQPLRVETVGGEECGSASISLTSRGGGLATVAWRVTSTSGPILDVELDASFSGRAGGAMRRFAVREPTLHAAGSSVALLGSGRATATMSGTVETFTATCRIAPASVHVHLR
ncbi:hypothetical protein [Microbacterium sp. VKM Ac-2923]|uniref:hypothetical protein n=1 Tax=Microbacterium sp. VKM Ac-2923 TaxID=2929476 RepID=UPI001FB39941|nr:hypothetical protein [Microbacterium sp. VKM Ac-2923]MCJ1707055.1 hypothetical protein [Microbacterium sp. VKM Ac-2923]